MKTLKVLLNVRSVKKHECEVKVKIIITSLKNIEDLRIKNIIQILV